MSISKRFLTLTVICALICPLLGGCGSASASTTQADPASTEAAATTAAATAAPTTAAETQAQPAQTEAAREVRPGKVRGKVLSDNGDMLIAGIIVKGEDGSRYRTTTNAYGGYYLELAPGHYSLTFEKGIEFSAKTIEVDVETLKTYYEQDIRLTQLYDSYAAGWKAGDTHQHTNYSDGSDFIEDSAVANASAGLYWGFLTDHNTSRGVPEWREAGNVNVLTDENGLDRLFHGFAGTEVTTEFGHFNSLGTAMTFDRYEINFTEAERASAAKNDAAREKIRYIAQQTERQGGLAQMNHPYSLTNMGAMNFLDAEDFDTFAQFSTMEIWNAYFVVPDGRFTVENSDNQNYRSKLLWYSSLNQVKNGGKFLTAVGATDNHDSSGPVDAKTAEALEKTPETIAEYQTWSRYTGKYCGSPTTYVYTGNEEISQESITAAILAGHAFISNGPVLNCRIGDAIFGDHVKAAGGSVTLQNDIFCRDGLTELRIVVNGGTVKTVSLNGETSFTEDITVEGLSSGDWLLVEALGDWTVYAISNPYFVD